MLDNVTVCRLCPGSLSWVAPPLVVPCGGCFGKTPTGSFDCARIPFTFPPARAALPRGHGPAPPPAFMVGRRSFVLGVPRGLRSFRLLWRAGPRHLRRYLGWLSIPVHLRLSHVAVSPSGSLGMLVSLLLRSRWPGSALPSRSWLVRGSGHRGITAASFRSAMQPRPSQELARPAAPGASFGIGHGSPSRGRCSGL